MLKGEWNDLRIEAQAAAEQLNELDLVIARLQGPVVVTQKKGEWRVVTDVVGSGVGGLGLLPPLLGPKPNVHVDLSRLPDGRVLFRALNVAGKFFSVDAQGDITLFGDLTFKGQVRAPSLAGLRPGAKGAVTATFNATSKKDSDFWRLQIDARGERLAIGVGEVDRLLGPSPTLTSRGSWTPQGFKFDRIELKGAAADAVATGSFSTAKTLDFALDWRAKGPFVVGPVEVAGGVTGEGKVTGTLAQPRADLHARLASLDLGRLKVEPAALDFSFLGDQSNTLDGLVALRGPSNYGAASAKAAFRFTPHGVDLRDIVADAGGVKLAGALALRDGAPSTADLTVAVGPGAFLQGGKVSGRLKIEAPPGTDPGAARTTVQLDGRDVTAWGAPVSLRSLQLSAQGPLDGLPLRLSVESADAVPWRFTGSGLLAKAGAGRELLLDGSGRVRGADLKTLETSRLRFGPDELSARLKLAVSGGTVSVDARKAGDSVEARAELTGVGLKAFNEDYVGTITGQLTASGRGRTLGGRADVTLKGARSRDAAPDLALDGTLHAELAGSRLRLTASAANAQGLRADGRLDLPAEAAADPFRIAVNRTKPISGEVSVDGELRPLWDLFLGGERTVSGRITGRGRIAGTLNDPQLLGGAQLANGAVNDSAIGLTLKNLQGSVEFGRNVITVRSFTGDDGRGGTLSAVTAASASRATAAPPFGSEAFERFHLFDNEYGRATASGACATVITRDAAGHARLAGKLGRRSRRHHGEGSHHAPGCGDDGGYRTQRTHALWLRSRVAKA